MSKAGIRLGRPFPENALTLFHFLQFPILAALLQNSQGISGQLKKINKN
jgi:hypothetical protein